MMPEPKCCSLSQSPAPITAAEGSSTNLCTGTSCCLLPSCSFSLVLCDSVLLPELLHQAALYLSPAAQPDLNLPSITLWEKAPDTPYNPPPAGSSMFSWSSIWADAEGHAIVLAPAQSSAVLPCTLGVPCNGNTVLKPPASHQHITALLWYS